MPNVELVQALLHTAILFRFQVYCIIIVAVYQQQLYKALIGVCLCVCLCVFVCLSVSTVKVINL